MGDYCLRRRKLALLCIMRKSDLGTPVTVPVAVSPSQTLVQQLRLAQRPHVGVRFVGRLLTQWHPAALIAGEKLADSKTASSARSVPKWSFLPR